MSVVPEQEQTIRRYRGAAGERYHHQKRALPEAAFGWVARLRAEKFAPYVGATDTVLEYGVGAGWNLAELKCGRKIGFDVSEFLEAETRGRGIEFISDISALADECADVAICHHALEHVLSPPAVLAEIRRLLKPDGRLLLYTPFEYESRYEHFERDEPNHHLYSWNVQTLANLVEECGFTVCEAASGRFGYSRFASVWANRLRAGERGFRALRWMLHALRPGLEARVVARKSALEHNERER